jgi:hypothetical protein
MANISQRDLKILWSRSGGRCAFQECRIELSNGSAESAYPLGEQAHIVGEKPMSPRGPSIFTEGERNAYPNLILLCPNHHTMIDNEVTNFPVEQLYVIKSAHEEWVRDRLGSKNEIELIQDEFYATVIDATEKACHFDDWEGWMYSPLFERASWVVDDITDIQSFRKYILAIAWPGKYLGLEVAIQRLSLALHAATTHFLVHADEKGDRFVEDRFYKRLVEWDVEKYERLSKQWDKWYNRHTELIHHATKAANWIAEEVRATLNPRYLASKYFLVTEADGFLSEAKLLLYRPPEKEAIQNDVQWELEHESVYGLKP